MTSDPHTKFKTAVDVDRRRSPAPGTSAPRADRSRDHLADVASTRPPITMIHDLTVTDTPENRPPPATHDELLTTADLAALTRAPTSTVRYWRYLGTGPQGFRIGRRVLYRRGEVLRWLAEHEAAANPPPAADPRFAT
jgi:hypothetical protein